MKRIVQLGLMLLAIFVIGVVAAGYLAPVDDTPSAGQAASADDRYISLGAVTVRYRQDGQGPDVLFIHGLPGLLEDADPLEIALGSRFRVTRYDRPGYGYSSGIDTPHTVSHNAAIAHDLIKALQLEDVIVVGHSYGGNIALKLAMDHPDSVRALILLATPALPDENSDPLFEWVAMPVLGEGIVRLSQWSGNLMAHHKIAHGVEEAFSPETVPEQFLDLRMPLWTQPGTALSTAREAVMLPVEQALMKPRYAQLDLPVLVLQGDQDLTVPPVNGYFLGKAIPHADYRLLENTGHYIQFARPGELSTLIGRVAETRPNQP